MARIPEAEIERLKREVNLVALVEASGVKLRRQGRDWVGLCRWHEDREPSFIVSPEKEPPLWRCAGACGAGGTAIDFLMRQERVDFRTAVARLQQMVGGVPIGGPIEPPPASSAPASSSADSESAGEPRLALWMDDRQLLDAAIGYYHETLLGAAPALSYLDGRGLLMPELLTHFDVGYADGTLGQQMPPRQSRPGQRFRSRVMALGIMRKGTGQEHMHGRVVVPTRDESDLVVGLYGRIVRSSGREDVTPRHLYLPGPRRGVLNWRCLLEHKEVILCESVFDAMTFWAAGFVHVTSAWGTGGFTEEHLATFRRHGVRRVLVAFDRDKAGDESALKVAERLLAAGIECFRVLFPRGMDANEYAVKVKPAEKSLGLAIRQAQWMGKGKPPAASTALPVHRVVETDPEAEATRKEEAAAEDAAASSPAEVSTTAAPTTTDPLPPSGEAPVTLGELEARAAASEKLASSLAALSGSPAAEPAASPAPPAPACDVPVEVHGEEVVLWLGDRRYRVRGLEKNLSHDLLKVNLLVSRGEALHVDTLDLYSARQRLPFVKQAAAELGEAEDVLRHDLQRVLLRLELLQRERIETELAPAAEAPPISEEEREAALALARDPHLVERIAEDLSRCGVVGEETNKLVGYLATTSRKLERPLAVMIQSSSAAGKSALMEALLDFVPEEERVKYSAMTGQSLFYMSEQDLRHKVLALVEEEGGERASYALKLLQSEGELSIASTGKDPQSGRLVTHEYHVEGPVALLVTTTAIELDEELLNRCLVLSVDEAREQTRAIHRFQRERRTLEGYARRRQKQRVVALHQNLQRIIRPLPVINPYAPVLDFLDEKTRTRRDHEKYLNLIEAIALLHQHQRPIREGDPTRDEPTEYLEVTLADIALANRLAGEVLGHSLDELPPQTRRLLGDLDRFVAMRCEDLGIGREDLRFTLRDVREWTGCGQTQLRLHLARLVDLEYVVVHRGGRGQTFVYELVYDGRGEDGRPFLPRLIDVAALPEGATVGTNLSGASEHLSGSTSERSGPNRPRNGVESGGSRSSDSPVIVSLSNPLTAERGKRPGIAAPGSRRSPSSSVAVGEPSR